jgi:hypothetical protein
MIQTETKAYVNRPPSESNSATNLHTNRKRSTLPFPSSSHNQCGHQKLCLGMWVLVVGLILVGYSVGRFPGFLTCVNGTSFGERAVKRKK